MKIKEKKGKSIEELYKAILSTRDSLTEALKMAQESVTISQQFGGEISRVITDQINTYFIPAIKKYVGDEDTPGAMDPLCKFLDSAPLAMIREDPAPGEGEVVPVVDATVDAPPEIGGQAEPEEAPADNSFAGLQEAKKDEPKASDSSIVATDAQFLVKRKCNSASSLGKEGKLVDETVNSFKDKESADSYIEELNGSIPESEKELTGIEYYVEPVKDFKQKTPEGASKKVKVDERSKRRARKRKA